MLCPQALHTMIPFQSLPVPGLRGSAVFLAGSMLSVFLLMLWWTLASDPFTVIVLTVFALLLLLSFRDQVAGLTGVIAVILLLPFAVLPLDLGFKPTFLNAAVVLVYLGWILHLIRRRDLQPLPPYTAGLVVLFGLLVLAAGFWGLNFARPSLFESRKVMEYLCNLGLFFLVLNIVHTPAQIRTTALVLAATGTLGALMGLVFHFLPAAWAREGLDHLTVFDYPPGEMALRFINDDPRGILRATGLAVDPNLLGAACVLSACILLPFLLGRHALPIRLGSGLALAILLGALYLTYSRNALLALCAVGAFLALVRYRSLVPLGIAGMVLLLLLPQTQAYVQRLVEGLMGQDLATRMRLEEYRQAGEVIRAYPWTGIGFFGTPTLAYHTGVSMVYLAVAATMGLPALGLFAIILGLPLVRFLKMHAHWRGHEMEPWMLGLASTLVGLVMTGLFDHFYINLLYPHMSALYWILLGLCTAALRLVDTPEVQGQARIRPAQPVLSFRSAPGRLQS